MFLKPYIMAISAALVFSVLAGAIGAIYWSIESKNREISSLREELLNKQFEIIKRNHELQKQANEFHAFNSKRHDYEKSLINKYTIPPAGNNPCEEGVLDSLLRKSFDNN